MKNFILKWMAIPILGIASVFSLPLMAIDYGAGPAEMVGRLVDKLDLNETQELQIRSLLAEGHQDAAKDRARVAVLHDELRAISADFDAGQAQQVADQIGVITSRLLYNHASVQAEIYTLLNEEQRLMLQQLLEQRQQRRDRMEQRLR